MQTLMPPVGTPDNKFHDGNPLTGEMGTIVEAAHLNNVQGAIRDTQSEIISILSEADIEPDGSTLQLLAAMKLLFAGNSDSLGALASLNGAANKLPYFTGNKAASLTDLTAVGRDIIAAATKDAVLQYLGLGNFKYGAPMIGELVEWPRAEMPQEIWPDCGMEFIPYMAQSFDAEKYPLLAQLHPTHALPADMRGEFVRGWDNGRGVNTGQALMAWAADEFKSHNHSFMGRFGGGSSANVMTNESAGTITTTNNTGGDETRPRSVAWNMIVRAK